MIKKIRKQEQWKNSNWTALNIFKTNSMCIVLIALKQGSEMAKQSAECMISLQVLKGKMEFITDEQTIELCKGQMLSLHKGVPHSLQAKEETVFMLTLTTALLENSYPEQKNNLYAT